MTHRRRFAVSTGRGTVIDLLLLDRLNPRSVLHQVATVHEHLKVLSPPSEMPRMPPVLREVLRLETDLATATAAGMDAGAVLDIATRAGALPGLLAETYLR